MKHVAIFFCCAWAVCSHAQQLPVPNEGLLAFYGLNGDALDAVGAFPGTLVGTPTPAEDRFGNPTGALAFEQGDRIVVPGTAGQNPLPFSVSVWYRPDSTYNFPYLVPLFKKYYPALWNGIQVAYAQFGEERDQIYPWYIRNHSNRVIGGYGSPSFRWISTAAEPLNGWLHVVFTVDSMVGKIYSNGQLVATQPWDGTAMASTNGLNWELAGKYEHADTVGYLGLLDDVGVWSRALTLNEVQNIYNSSGSYAGCTDAAACNYDPNATEDNGTCAIPGEPCNDGDSMTILDAYAADCGCTGMPVVNPNGNGPCEGNTSITYLGVEYDLVELAGKCWFKENLATEVFLNGDTIPFVASGPGWPSISAPRRGVYGDNAASASETGYMYNFPVVKDARGVCPTDWAVASLADFTSLVSTYGSDNHLYRSEGTLDQGTGLWTGLSPATNATGFSGMPFGMRSNTGGDEGYSNVTAFWSKEEPLPQSGDRWILGYVDWYPFQSFWHLKSRGAYVRCVYTPPPVPGCMDSGACNFNSEANEEDGSCIFPLFGDDCNAGAAACASGTYWSVEHQQCLPVGCAVCRGDMNSDGYITIVDLLEMLAFFNETCAMAGCTDPEALNFHPEAVIDDGSCVMPE